LKNRGTFSRQYPLQPDHVKILIVYLVYFEHDNLCPPLQLKEQTMKKLLLILLAIISITAMTATAQTVVTSSTPKAKHVKAGNPEKKERKQAQKDEKSVRKEYKSASERRALKKHKPDTDNKKDSDDDNE
jgi:hypothetical protein